MRPWLVVTACVLATAGVGTSRGDGSAAGRSGMEAHVDPRSGALVPEPPVPAPAAPLPAPGPTLREMHAPGGGMMIRLDGRFMSDVVATVRPDGSVALDCHTRETPSDRSR